MGTGAFAVPSLLSLSKSRHVLAAVVSQPDKPRGRGLKTVPVPVKKIAEEAGINVWQPDSLKDEEARQKLGGFKPDIIVVAAYGKILPDWVMHDCRFGAINIHGSILPAYRGAAPVQRAIMNGEVETGVTIIKVAPDVDTGDILISQTVEIGPDETSGELMDRLAAVGAAMIVPAVDVIESGRATWTPQPMKGTDAPKINKTEANIDWLEDAITIKNLVRGLNPDPGAFFQFRGARIKLWRAAAAPKETDMESGIMAGLEPAGPVVSCGEGNLVLTEVQPAGKKAMTGADFNRGYRPRPGEILK